MRLLKTFSEGACTICSSSLGLKMKSVSRVLWWGGPGSP
jgi:hypothetical protein